MKKRSKTNKYCSTTIQLLKKLLMEKILKIKIFLYKKEGKMFKNLAKQLPKKYRKEYKETVFNKNRKFGRTRVILL